MRLTLRTLLAYLDDVLDPVDKEELSQKIESSDFAEDLVHRTRDTVRRLRLSAPKVIGTGMGLDPNTVAEYLDNVMPPDQVGDFERICLDSDIHLAEATACHHVLTMVLGAPADVDPIARQRMYTIATEAGGRKLRIEPAHSAPVTTVAAAIAATSPAANPNTPSPRPHTSEVPDYLRSSPWWLSTPAILGLAVVVLIGTSVMFLSGFSGWFGKHPEADRLTADNASRASDVVVAPPATVTGPPAANGPDSAVASSAAPGSSTDPLLSPPQPLAPGIPPLNVPPVAQTENPSATSVPPDPYAPTNPPAAASLAAAPAANNPPSNSITDSTEAPGTAIGPGAAPPVPTNTPPADAVASANPPLAAPPLPPPSTGTAVRAAPLASAAPSSATVPPAAPEGALASAAPPLGAIQGAAPPAAPPDSGTYMGGKTVLLRHDDKAGTWFRVQPRSPIVPDERVLSLPEFRPRIALVSGLQLDLSGGTQLTMGLGGDVPAATAPEIVPTLDLVYGRMVLVNPTNAPKQIRLKLGAHLGLVTLNHNATLGVELERKHVPGDDPRQTPAPVEVRLFAPDGGIVWHDEAGDKTIDKPSRRALTAAGAGEVSDDHAPPEWIDHEPVGQPSEQRYGAPVIESSLATNAPADTQLLELYQSSTRKEVKSLVARSCIHVGLFQPFIDALHDSDQKSNWKSHVDTLRTAMSLSPESANKVWQTLAEQRGKPAAGDLYEMLCGYNADQIGHSPEQIKSGAISKLINWLEDDNLDYRVLAVQDLNEITGKQFMQDPAAKPVERKRNVQRWRARLEAGELKPVGQP